MTLFGLVRIVAEVEGGGFEVVNLNAFALVTNGSALVAGVVADEMTGVVGVGETTRVRRFDMEFVPNFRFKIGGEEGNVAVFEEDAIFFK